MYLENLVFDASDPQRLGRFWQAAVGGKMLTDEPDAYETRLSVDDGPVLDLCFQRVPEPPSEPVRLHLDLLGGPRRREVVDRLLGLGARHADIGQGDVPWVVLADPEGNVFCVMEAREEYVETGPIAAVPIDAADPPADARFWSWLTGWVPVNDERLPSGSSTVLRHPSGRGMLLEFCPEPQPKPRRRTACTSTSASRPATIPTWSRPVSPSRAGSSCTRAGGSCHGGSSATHRATSSACFPPGTSRQADRPGPFGFLGFGPCPGRLGGSQNGGPASSPGGGPPLRLISITRVSPPARSTVGRPPDGPPAGQLGHPARSPAALLTCPDAARNNSPSLPPTGSGAQPWSCISMVACRFAGGRVSQGPGDRIGRRIDMGQLAAFEALIVTCESATASDARCRWESHNNKNPIAGSRMSR